MSQPKITVSQLDAGTGPSALVVQSELFPIDSGRLVKSVYAVIPASSGTTVIPFDSTAPLITEGTEFITLTITPSAATSHVRVEFSVTTDASANNTTIIVAIFRGSTCVCAMPVTIDATGKPKTHSVSYMDSPATAAAVVYSGRIGVTSAGPTWYVNSVASGATLGGTITTSAGVEEFA